MNKIWILGLFFLIACSKQVSDKPEGKPIENSEIQSQWNLSSIEVGNLDFGLVDFNKQKILTVNIINDGDSVISGIPVIESSDFDLLFSSCLDLKPEAKCYIKISFNPKDKEDSIYTGNIVYGTHINTLSAQINRTGQISDSIFKSNNQSLSNYNFGTIEYRHNLIKSIFIHNTGAVVNNKAVDMTLSGAFQKIYDRCSNRNLEPNKSCLVKVLLTGQGQAGPISGTLSYGSKNFNFSAHVKTQEELAQENSEFVFIYNNQSSNNPINLETINLNITKEYKFYVKNIGSSAGQINELNLSSDFNVVYNNCQNQMLLPNQSCYLRGYLTPQQKGSFSTNINSDVSYQTNSQSVQWTVRSPGDKIECTNQISFAQLANINWSGQVYSSCLVESCLPTHHINDNACESNVISCSVPNGSGTQSWNVSNSQYEECVVNSCENNRYAIVNNSCDYIEPIAQSNNHSLLEDSQILNEVFNYSATNPSTVQIISGVSHGILIQNGNGYSYTPFNNYNGIDSFTYRVNDGQVNSNIVTISFTVNSVNDVPVAQNNSGNITNEDFPVDIALSGTDLDMDTLTYEVASQPLNGSVIVNGTTATYIPNSNFNGLDSFTFVTKDATSQSAPATVSVSVLPINDQPIAQSQTLGIVEDTQRTFTLVGSDVEGSALTYTVTQQPTEGILTGTAPNLTYTPAYNFSGEVTMKFKVRDGTLDSSEVTVTLTNNLISKDYLNERIAVLETKYRNKGYNITLPRIAAEPVSVADINAVSAVINSLALTDTTSTLIPAGAITPAAVNTAFAKHTNIRLHCTNISTCYSNKTAYNKAIYGTNILTVQNNFLWDSANSRYLGTKCDAWYTTGELAWVDRILDASKTNYWNGTYADNTTNNRYLTVFNNTAPTCGTVYYAYNQGCRSYGYAYVTIGGVQYPSSNMGNGGCANGSGTVSISKGQSVHIGSHYYASGTIRTGY